MSSPTLDNDADEGGDGGEHLHLARERNEKALFRAVNEAMQTLVSSGDQVTALNESFALVKSGLDAQKGLLLYFREGDTRPEILFAAGLNQDQLEACVGMRSSDGVSPTVIRKVLESQDSVFIPNSQALGSALKTAALQDGNHSVIAVPVVDPRTKSVIAVLYLENKGALYTFEEDDLAWLTMYALAIGQGFGLYRAQNRRIEEEVAAERRRHASASAPEIIGDSEETRRVMENLLRVFIPNVERDRPEPILVLGPRGSGKELVAKFLHYYSPRRSKHPYVQYNCANLSKETAVSTLFGHTKGSFTGAVADAPGLFRSAHRGVLFLDEVGELPLDVQSMLLRVLEQREVQPLGQTAAASVDVCVVFATNVNLNEAVKEGRFREDLYDRIGGSGLRVKLKPLGSAERWSDIRPLLSYFLLRNEEALQKKTGGFTPEAFQALMKYSWIGNVRELGQVCATLVTWGRAGEPITEADIQEHCPEVLTGPEHPDAGVFLADNASHEAAMNAYEAELIRRRMERFGNVAAASESLKLSKTHLYRLMKSHSMRTDVDGREREQSSRE